MELDPQITFLHGFYTVWDKYYQYQLIITEDLAQAKKVLKEHRKKIDET